MSQIIVKKSNIYYVCKIVYTLHFEYLITFCSVYCNHGDRMCHTVAHLLAQCQKLIDKNLLQICALPISVTPSYHDYANHTLFRII